MGAPDPKIQRPFDLSVKPQGSAPPLYMNPGICGHTHVYRTCFGTLDDEMSYWRAAALNAGCCCFDFSDVLVHTPNGSAMWLETKIYIFASWVVLTRPWTPLPRSRGEGSGGAARTQANALDET